MRSGVVVTVETVRASPTSVVRVQGAMPDVARSAGEAILQTLAVDRGPVVADLTQVHGPISARSVALLAAAPARHTRDWPGTPIGFACPSGPLQFHLSRQAGPHVVLSQQLPETVAQVQNPPRVTVIRQHLPAVPASAAVARGMVATACRQWARPTQLGPAGAIISELVNNAVRHARAGLWVSVAQCGPALRLAVGDGGGLAPPRLPPSDLVAPHGRDVFLVSSLAQSWGVLPSGDGNTVVWAVLTTALGSPTS